MVLRPSPFSFPAGLQSYAATMRVRAAAIGSWMLTVTAKMELVAKTVSMLGVAQGITRAMGYSMIQVATPTA